MKLLRERSSIKTFLNYSQKIKTTYLLIIHNLGQTWICQVLSNYFILLLNETNSRVKSNLPESINSLFTNKNRLDQICKPKIQFSEYNYFSAFSLIVNGGCQGAFPCYQPNFSSEFCNGQAFVMSLQISTCDTWDKEFFFYLLYETYFTMRIRVSIII